MRPTHARCVCVQVRLACAFVSSSVLLILIMIIGQTLAELPQDVAQAQEREKVTASRMNEAARTIARHSGGGGSGGGGGGDAAEFAGGGRSRATTSVAPGGELKPLWGNVPRRARRSREMI